MMLQFLVRYGGSQGGKIVLVLSKILIHQIGGNLIVAGNASFASEVNVAPIGSIILWGSDTMPNGKWKLCNGAQYNKNFATYSTLFGILGYKFGGSGNNFRVPNMKNRFVAGKGASGDLANVSWSNFCWRQTGGSRNAILVAHSRY